MDNEIEKLKQERDEILAKALRAVHLMKQSSYDGHAWKSAIAEIEALKPKPERLRLWVNEESNGAFSAYGTRELALRCGEELTRVAVHMREVRPIGDVPTWEEWEVSRAVWIKVKGGDDIFCCHTPEAAANLVARHNSTARRLQDFINQLLAERGEG